MVCPPPLPPILNELADRDTNRFSVTVSRTPNTAKRRPSLLMTCAPTPPPHISQRAQLLTCTRFSSPFAVSVALSTDSTTGCPPSAPRPLADTVPALMRRRSERHAPSLLFSFHVVHVRDDTTTWDGWLDPARSTCFLFIGFVPTDSSSSWSALLVGLGGLGG